MAELQVTMTSDETADIFVGCGPRVAQVVRLGGRWEIQNHSEQGTFFTALAAATRVKLMYDDGTL